MATRLLTLGDGARWPLGRTLALGALALAAGLPLALLPLSWAAALLGGVAVTLLVLIRPEAGLYLLAFSVPYESLRELALGGVTLGSTQALVGLTALAWALRLATVRERPAAPLNLARPLLPMVAAVLLSSLRAVESGAALKELLRWLELLLVYVAAADLLRADRRKGLMLGLLLLAGVSQALLGLVQFVLRWGPEGFRTGAFLRAYGTFGQPNPFAGYLGTLLPLGLALLLCGWLAGAPRRGLGFALTLGASALLGAALLASQSRGGLLGLMLAVAVIGSLASRRAFLATLVLGVVGAFVLLLGTFDLLPAVVAGRLTQITSYFGLFDVRTVVLTPANWAVVERMAVWQAAWGMFEAHPFLGVGAGNYVAAYPGFMMPGWPDPMGHAHNLYLTILAENGAIGLAAFLALWLGLLGAVWRALRAAGSLPVWWRRALPLGVLGVLAQVSMHNFFDNLMVHGLNVQLALLLALATGPTDGEGKVDGNC
ncbi:MAG: O-antigen ligase family protein [Chloroflexota bacterium]